MNSVLGEITLIQVADLGKIKFMSLELKGDKLIRLAGPNEAGKSTVLDRLQNLFQKASAVPDGLIRHGMYTEGANAGRPIDRGMARIETTNGYVIEQIIRKTKNEKQVAELKVTHNNMPVAGGPLAFLQSVSSKYPDPHKIANLSEKELFKELYSLLDLDFSALDKQIADAKADAQGARAVIKNLGAAVPLPNEPEPANMATGEDLTENLRVAHDAYNRAVAASNDYRQKLTTGKELLKDLTERVAALTVDVGFMEKNPTPEPNRGNLTAIETQIIAGADNSALIDAWKNYKADSSKRAEQEQVLASSADVVTKSENGKKEMLETAKIPGSLRLTEDGKIFRGEGTIRWETASLSSRLTMATELCIETIPEGALRAIYIQRGESVGTEKRETIAKIAKEMDVQVFMEVFSEDAVQGDGVFMLEEGEIVDKPKDKLEEIPEYEMVVFPPKETVVDTPEPNWPVPPVEKPVVIGTPGKSDLPQGDLFGEEDDPLDLF